MTESRVAREILAALSKLRNVRLFRNQVGQGWVGRVVNRDARTITLMDYRPIKFGLVLGSSDYIGWTSVTVGPEHIGMQMAVLTAIETKASRTAKRSTAQRHFIETVRKAGGKAGFASNIDEAREIVGDGN